MKSKLLLLPGILALIVALAACGGGQDEQTDAPAAESSRDTTVSSAGQQGRNEAEQSVEEAAESTQNAAETAAGRVRDAGERAAEMAGEAGDEAQRMVDEAGEEAQRMVDEAGDRAEEMMSEAAGAMSSGGESAAGGSDSGDPCEVNVQVGDSIAYSVDSISVPSSCGSVTINLDHTGSLPKAAMGHNWVLIPADAVQAIGMAGMSAGLESGYLPDDDRIVAATDLVGGGESTSVSFSLDDLEEGTEYAYVCTFPGHWSAMRGSFSVQ